MNILRSRKTDLKESMDRDESKQGGQECPVQGAYEDIGQFVVVNTSVWGLESRFWRDQLLLVPGSIERVHWFSIYRYYHATTTGVARSIAPANPGR